MTDVFDPADHTVDEVKAYVDDHPDEAARIAEAERAGKARSTLLDTLAEGGEAEQTDVEPTEPPAAEGLYAGYAQPPLSDPSHPDHQQWAHEHAGEPDPDQAAKAKEERDSAVEAEAAARAEPAEPEPAESA